MRAHVKAAEAEVVQLGNVSRVVGWARLDSCIDSSDCDASLPSSVMQDMVSAAGWPAWVMSWDESPLELSSNMIAKTVS
ncbi:hypothetical protein CHS0354_023418 [Potamilus streckersoni]|uniref:Uncharacterized protein n=1 Tax=Potamilus streckersoni TaxID=2493646 RepID=A0AAE0VGF4_9BIVA|nr:hypothetical protein CHS0354_023418 [Potamilus streckersoni]